MLLMNLLKALGSNEGDIVTLLVDNAYVITLAKNPIAHGMSKHIEMRFHYLRKLISEGMLRLEYCWSEEQVVNLLTKEILIEVYKRLKMNMTMEDLKHLIKVMC